MLSILEKVAFVYSFATLFLMELLYQILKTIINGTRYSFTALKNTLTHAIFEILADTIMVLIDFLQSLIESLSISIKKAITTASEFTQYKP